MTPESVIRVTENCLRQRSDLEYFVPVDPDDPGDVLTYSGGPDYFADECIYDPVDDATARQLLNAFLTGPIDRVGWPVYLELSKLLWTRGHLVAERADALMREMSRIRRATSCRSC